MALGIGLSLTDFGSVGSISDAADGATSAAALFLAANGPHGMVIDFTDASIAINDAADVLDFTSSGQVSGGALVGPGALLSQSSPSDKLLEQVDGTLKWRGQNLYLNNGAPANQSITVLSGASYEIKITGTVSITLSGAATGTVTAGTTAFTAATGTLTCGSTSGAGKVYVRRTPCNQVDIDTAGAAVYDLPYVYSGGERTAILPEPAATNLCLYARDLTQSNWAKTSASAALTATGVDGVANSASTLTASSTNGVALQNITASSAAYSGAISLKRRTGTGAVTIAVGETTGSELVTNGTFTTNTTGWLASSCTINSVSSELEISAQSASPGTVTQTISGMTVGKFYRITGTYRQGGTGGTAARMSFFGNTTANNATATPVTGSVVAYATATSATLSLQSFGTAATLTYFDNVSVMEVAETVVDLSSGNWVRASILNKTLTNPCVAVKLATSGDAVDVDISQLESGTVATSPIITYGAAVARAADVLPFPGASLPAHGGAVTLFIEYRPRGWNSTNFVLTLYTDTTNYMNFRRNSATALAYEIYSGGALQATAGVAVTAGAPIKAALAAELNSSAMAVNGTATATDTSVTMPVGTPTGLHLNSSGANILQGPNDIVRVGYLIGRKSNASMEAMTA